MLRGPCGATAVIAVIFVAALGCGRGPSTQEVLADDERAPIRVKNDVLRIETHYKKWKQQSGNDGQPGTDGLKWDFEGGPQVTAFIVTAYGSNDVCAGYEGDTVTITYTPAGHTQKYLKFTLDSGRPILDSELPLETVDNNKRRKLKLKLQDEPKASISNVSIQTGTGRPFSCDFPTDKPALVDICWDNCQ